MKDFIKDLNRLNDQVYDHLKICESEGSNHKCNIGSINRKEDHLINLLNKVLEDVI